MRARQDGGVDVRRSLEQRVGAALGARVVEAAVLGGGDVSEAYRMGLEDGRMVFAKTHRNPPPGFFATEAASLAWLGERLHQLRPLRSDGPDEPRRRTTRLGKTDRRRLGVCVQPHKTSDKLIHGLPPVLAVDHAQPRSTCGSAHASAQPTKCQEADRLLTSTADARLPMAGHDV